MAEVWGVGHNRIAGETSDAAPEMIAQFRSQLAQLQAELPEHRQDPQIERLRQVQAAIEQLKPSSHRLKPGRASIRQ